MSAKTCVDCPAFRPPPGNLRRDLGECRCNAPVRAPGDGRGNFPRVAADDWCYRGREIMAKLEEA